MRAIIVENEKLLVNSTENKATGVAYCALPGGHVHIYESCPAALEREFREELATDIKVHELKFVSESIYEGRRADDVARHELVLYFHSELLSPLGQEDGRIMSPEFDKNFIWLPLDQLTEANLLPLPIREYLQQNLVADGTPAASGVSYGFHDSTR